MWMKGIIHASKITVFCFLPLKLVRIYLRYVGGLLSLAVQPNNSQKNVCINSYSAGICEPDLTCLLIQLKVLRTTFIFQPIRVFWVLNCPIFRLLYCMYTVLYATVSYYFGKFS
jgi:hypothetical protein